LGEQLIGFAVNALGEAQGVGRNGRDDVAWWLCGVSGAESGGDRRHCHLGVPRLWNALVEGGWRIVLRNACDCTKNDPPGPA
jgi:hypothetical protein